MLNYKKKKINKILLALSFYDLIKQIIRTYKNNNEQQLFINFKITLMSITFQC